MSLLSSIISHPPNPPSTLTQNPLSLSLGHGGPLSLLPNPDPQTPPSQLSPKTHLHTPPIPLSQKTHLLSQMPRGRDFAFAEAPEPSEPVAPHHRVGAADAGDRHERRRGRRHGAAPEGEDRLPREPH